MIIYAYIILNISSPEARLFPFPSLDAFIELVASIHFAYPGVLGGAG